MVFADLHIHSKEFLGEPKGSYFQHDVAPVDLGSVKLLSQVLQDHKDTGKISKRGSDGTLNTIDILRLAKQIGLRAISIVDHWNLKAIPHTMIYALEHDVPMYLSGMECKPDFLDIDKRIKLPSGTEFLAYYFNPDDKRLGDFVDHKIYGDLIRKANWLKELRVSLATDITVPSFSQCLTERNANRFPLANQRSLYDYIVSLNINSIMPYPVFCDFLASVDNNSWLPKFSLQEYAALVHSAGGIIGWAHPLRSEDPSFYRTLLETGWLDFVEGKYNYEAYLRRKPAHEGRVREGMSIIQQLIQEYNMPISGGSDDHDGTRMGIEGLDENEFRTLARVALARHGLEHLLSRSTIPLSLSKLKRPAIIRKSQPEYLLVQWKSSPNRRWTFPAKSIDQGDFESSLRASLQADLGIESPGLLQIHDYSPSNFGPLLYFSVPFFCRADSMHRNPDGAYSFATWMTLKEIRSEPTIHPEVRHMLPILENIEAGIYRI